MSALTDVSHISTLYRQQAPVNVVVKAMESVGLSWDVQEAFLENVFLSTPAVKFSPPARYTFAVLGSYTDKIQAAEVEDLSDGLFSLVSKLQPRSQETHGFISFDLPAPVSSRSSPGTTIAVRVEPQHNEVGLRMWEAGYLLTEYCLVYPELVRGRTVIELGAGLGLTGMAAASNCCCASRVLLTDCAQVVLENLEENLALNELTTSKIPTKTKADTTSSSGDSSNNNSHLELIEVAELDWLAGGSAALEVIAATLNKRPKTKGLPSANHGAPSGPDCEDGWVVLAADVLYDPAVVPHFVNVVEALVMGSRGGGAEPGKDESFKEEKSLPSGSESFGAASQLPPSAPGSPCRPRRRPIALVAATLRNPATLALFLDEVSRRKIPISETNFRWSTHRTPTSPLESDQVPHPGLSPFHFDPSSVRLFALGSHPEDGSSDWGPLE